MISTNYELNEKEYKYNSFRNRILHNRRERETENSIFSTKNNYIYECEELKKLKKPEDLDNYFKNEEIELKKKIKDKTGRKSQMKLHILETIISISNDEDIENFKNEEELKNSLIEKMDKYVKHYEEVHKVKVYGYYLHFDEGHINNDKKEIKNIHIHLIHSNVMDNGKSWLREVYNNSKKGIDLLQDNIRNEFDMKRGVKGSNKKHIRSKEFKEIKQKEQELEQIKIELQKEKNISKNLKNENENLKKEVENLKNEILKLKEKIENSYKNNREQIISSNLSNEIKKLLHKQNKKLKDNLKILQDRKNKGSFGFTIQIFNDLVNIHNKISELLNDNGEIQQKINNILNNNLLSEEDKKFYIDKLLNNDDKNISSNYTGQNLE